MWFQKESQLAALAVKNGRGLEKMPGQRRSYRRYSNVPFKGFDTIIHCLLLAKIEAYGFSLTSLKSMQSYSCKRFQRTIINWSFSNWTEIIQEFLGVLVREHCCLTFLE